jgi:hypothetical protein
VRKPVRPTIIALAAVAAILGASASAAQDDLRGAQLQDLTVLERDYLSADRALTLAAKRRAQALIDGLKRRAGRMSPQQFHLGMAEVVAQADNGHSSIGYGHNPGAGPAERLPLRLGLIGDRMFILKALPPHAAAAGAEVLEIEGRPAIEVVRALFRYQGGTPAWRRLRAMGLIEAGGMLHAAGLAARPDRLVLRLRGKGGLYTLSATFVAAAGARAPGLSHWAWAPDPSSQWTSAPTQGTPLYLQEPAAAFRLVRQPLANAWYLQFRAHHPLPGQDLEAFVAEVGRRWAADPSADLIVDLRFDMGGNGTYTAALLKRLAEEASGRIYVIVGPRTFSAGMGAAAILKTFGRDKVRLVGEGVGDRLRFWSEHEPVCLPNARICAMPNTGLWDLGKGCDGEPGCYDTRWGFAVRVDDLEPDLPAPLTPAAYFAGRDPAMEAIAADVVRRPLP